MTIETHATTFAFGATGYPPDGIVVSSFHGRERVSRLFSFDITLVVEDADRAAMQPALLGQNAFLYLDHDTSPRRIDGIVASVDTGRSLANGKGSLQVRLVPRLALLRHRRQSRIFQDMSLVDIIDAILGEHAVNRIWRLTGQPPTRAYTVQYHETDHGFVDRLLAEEGIAYAFESGSVSGDPDGGTVVFFDDMNGISPVDGDEGLSFAEESQGLAPDEHHVQELTFARSMRSTRLRLRDYDFQKPLLDAMSLVTASDADRAPGEPVGTQDVYEHDGDYQEVDVTDAKARVHLDQVRRRAAFADGRTQCRRLVPGRRFTLSEHPVQPVNQPYMVTRVEHVGQGVGGAVTQAGGGTSTGAPGSSASKRYEARFRAVPVTATVRPKRPHRVLRQVVETAIVRGTPGSEIDTDAFGRVRVQFHWDQPDIAVVNAPDFTSCWVRVAVPWAGSGLGVQFVPRAGMEVLVAFIDGDTDRPVVIGCLSNPLNAVPFPLPDNATKSGIRTQSTPGGKGFNELSFEDRAGAELLYLRAEKDMAVEARERHSLSVGGDRVAAITGDDALTVQGTRKVTVDGEAHEEVAGDASRVVGGNLSSDVIGSRSSYTEGHDVATVSGNLVLTVRGDIAVSTQSNYILSAGTGDGGEAVINVSGNLVAGASQVIRVMAQQSLVLACGDSTITLSPDGIKLEGGTIVLKGAKGVSAEGPGPALSLADEAQMTAKSIKIIAESSRVELDTAATIKSNSIKMASNSPPIDPTKAAAATADGDKLLVQYLDENGQPYAGKKYRLSVEGKIVDGALDADGKISEDIPKTAKVAELRLWIDDYPEGRVRSYAIDIDRDFPDANTPRGAKLRLKNLGYFVGVVDDSNDGLADAIVLFQRAREIDVTGELDEKTIAELQKVHGH